MRKNCFEGLESNTLKLPKQPSPYSPTNLPSKIETLQQVRCETGQKKQRSWRIYFFPFLRLHPFCGPCWLTLYGLQKGYVAPSTDDHHHFSMFQKKIWGPNLGAHHKNFYDGLHAFRVIKINTVDTVFLSGKIRYKLKLSQLFGPTWRFIFPKVPILPLVLPSYQPLILFGRFWITVLSSI